MVLALSSSSRLLCALLPVHSVREAAQDWDLRVRGRDPRLSSTSDLLQDPSRVLPLLWASVPICAKRWLVLIV